MAVEIPADLLAGWLCDRVGRKITLAAAFGAAGTDDAGAQWAPHPPHMPGLDVPIDELTLLGELGVAGLGLSAASFASAVSLGAQAFAFGQGGFVPVAAAAPVDEITLLRQHAALLGQPGTPALGRLGGGFIDIELIPTLIRS